jgi:FkbH-like protein
MQIAEKEERKTEWQVFRNYTVEPYFERLPATFSAYEDISRVDSTVSGYLFLYFVPLQCSSQQAARKVRGYREMLAVLSERLPRSKSLIVFTLAVISTYNWIGGDGDLAEALEEFNGAARELARRHDHIKVVEISSFFSYLQSSVEAGSNIVDWKYFYLYQVPLNPKLANLFGDWMKQQLAKIAFIRKKLLILDLDGILWGGVVGEDDVHIGESYPGNVYRDIQQMIKAAKDTGVLLAICSKNNVKDVEELFRVRADMPLCLADFVAVKCNWRDKAVNIREICSELNLDPESAVFIDDSPFERASLIHEIPQLLTPELPSQPYLLVPRIRNLLDEHFSTHEVTAEDRQKSEHYRLRNSIQHQVAGGTVSMEAFLDGLGMRLAVREVDSATSKRFVQLTQKTNQFNLTTKRMTDSELADCLNRGDLAYILTVKDSLGEHGITGAALVHCEPDGRKASIELFLLSCRILGRGIESAFLTVVINRLYQRGIQVVTSQFIPSSRNEQTANFYETFGFELLREEPSCKKYSLKLHGPRALSPRYTLEGDDDGRQN